MAEPSSGRGTIQYHRYLPCKDGYQYPRSGPLPLFEIDQPAVVPESSSIVHVQTDAFGGAADGSLAARPHSRFPKRKEAVNRSNLSLPVSWSRR
ncbi:uncharacterized protein LY79DRAFT_556502 [Colletotrichum navitas]|uniref:Uncharacterized protein n=1 Tax=Colletotrichum navitas TaxID=681940 RepID=A0AAD8PWY7_9PEZI|nr:uncharacterized protein LY79DRAFT_556502 [Colletotrichum navitas]KAK1589618.1 hypothetical protein LY79DRAFT_556502 [Colletotrichum navitas]